MQIIHWRWHRRSLCSWSVCFKHSFNWLVFALTDWPDHWLEARWYVLWTLGVFLSWNTCFIRGILIVWFFRGLLDKIPLFEVFKFRKADIEFFWCWIRSSFPIPVTSFLLWVFIKDLLSTEISQRIIKNFGLDRTWISFELLIKFIVYIQWLSHLVYIFRYLRLIRIVFDRLIGIMNIRDFFIWIFTIPIGFWCLNKWRLIVFLVKLMRWRRKTYGFIGKIISALIRTGKEVVSRMGVRGLAFTLEFELIDFRNLMNGRRFWKFTYWRY